MRQTEQPNSFQEIMRVLRRRKFLIFFSALTGFTGFLYTTSLIKPEYTAQAEIIYDRKDADLAFVNTQETLLQTERLVYDTVDAMGLAEGVAEYMSRNLSIEQSKDSHVIHAKYTSRDQKHAASVLNTLLDEYKAEYTAQNKVDETSPLDQVQANYQQTLSELETTIINAQEELALLDAEKPVAKPASVGKIFAMNVAEKEHQRAAEAYNKLNDNGIIEDNRTLSALRKKLSVQNDEIAHLSSRYGEKHPKMITAKADLAIIEDQLKNERSAVRSQIIANYEKTKDSLQSLVAQVRNRDVADPYASRKEALGEMIAVAQTTRDKIENQYMDLIANMIEPAAGTEAFNLPFTITPARIVDNGFADSKSRIILLGTLASMLAGVLLSLILEITRKTYLSGREMQDTLGHPCYALIPQTKADKNRALGDYVIDNPISTTTEALRTLKLAMTINSPSGSLPKVISVTSSTPGEGKTTLSTWLAKLSAKSGQRVILIDTDFRKPNVHKIMGTKNTDSLVEYLVGGKDLSDVIDTSDPTGLHVLYGRDVPNSATDLIASAKMGNLINTLRHQYDLVIIDTPACMSVSDTLSVARFSELLLYAVAWNRTTRQTVHNGISQFEKFKNTQIATVLTNIDLKKHVEYGYGEAIIHYGGYQAA